MKNKNLAERWLFFANDDLKIIDDVIREEVYHLACFHAQQAVEKALKGFIIFNKDNIEKTHSLIELLNEAIKIDKKFDRFRDYCLILDRYYTTTRYPDALPGSLPEGLPGKDKAQEAFIYAKEVLDFIEGAILR